MTKAIRNNKGKPKLCQILDHLPLAIDELCKARDFGIRSHTNVEKSIDGRTNFRESIGTEHHAEFVDGCRDACIRHIRSGKSEGRVPNQDNVHHYAYAALNALMALEYELSVEDSRLKPVSRAGQVIEVDRL